MEGHFVSQFLDMCSLYTVELSLGFNAKPGSAMKDVAHRLVLIPAKRVCLFAYYFYEHVAGMDVKSCGV